MSVRKLAGMVGVPHHKNEIAPLHTLVALFVIALGMLLVFPWFLDFYLRNRG